eukprot:TRINITY_DN49543_c1_g1_i1.p1 TRINITY_DN49543_c1_g1~~TRINITY_DN49543_c1_g1_i1.p1  ORF type:complete len:263 (+),score=27.82 TRINITY_DN49543_c1_g1_i1:51-839(+)
MRRSIPGWQLPYVLICFAEVSVVARAERFEPDFVDPGALTNGSAPNDAVPSVQSTSHAETPKRLAHAEMDSRDVDLGRSSKLEMNTKLTNALDDGHVLRRNQLDEENFIEGDKKERNGKKHLKTGEKEETIDKDKTSHQETPKDKEKRHHHSIASSGRANLKEGHKSSKQDHGHEHGHGYHHRHGHDHSGGTSGLDKGRKFPKKSDHSRYPKATNEHYYKKHSGTRKNEKGRVKHSGLTQADGSVSPSEGSLDESDTNVDNY